MLQEGICQQGQGLFGVEQHIVTTLCYLFKKMYSKREKIRLMKYS